MPLSTRIKLSGGLFSEWFISRQVCRADIVATERINSLFSESRSQLHSETELGYIQLIGGRHKVMLVKHPQHVTVACRNSVAAPHCHRTAIVLPQCRHNPVTVSQRHMIVNGISRNTIAQNDTVPSITPVGLPSVCRRRGLLAQSTEQCYLFHVQSTEPRYLCNRWNSVIWAMDMNRVICSIDGRSSYALLKWTYCVINWCNR